MFRFRHVGSLVDGDLELVLVDEYPGDRDKGYLPAYKFKMTLVGTSQDVGLIELRVGSTDALVRYGGHVGYGVAPAHRGHHYAARACRLLFPLARSHGLNPLWITCNPGNLASRRTCELAGAELVEILDLPKDTDLAKRGEVQKCRYRIVL